MQIEEGVDGAAYLDIRVRSLHQISQAILISNRWSGCQLADDILSILYIKLVVSFAATNPGLWWKVCGR